MSTAGENRLTRAGGAFDVSGLMSTDDVFEDLKSRLRMGDVEAVALILERLGPRVFYAVRRRLNRRMRSRFDSEDFVQAVWASFFTKASRIAMFDDTDGLVAYLAQVAANKVITECRAQTAAKRDVGREDGGVSEGFIPGDDDTPSAIAIANEQRSRLLRDLEGGHRRMVELRFSGCTHAEIAIQLDVSERTVRRFFKRLERRIS